MRRSSSRRIDAIFSSNEIVGATGGGGVLAQPAAAATTASAIVLRIMFQNEIGKLPNSTSLR